MLQQILAQATSDSAASLRILLNEDQPGLSLDSAREGDVSLAYEGHALPLLDPRMSHVLDHAAISVLATPDGDRLTLSEPTEEGEG